MRTLSTRVQKKTFEGLRLFKKSIRVESCGLRVLVEVHITTLPSKLSRSRYPDMISCRGTAVSEPSTTLQRLLRNAPATTVSAIPNYIIVRPRLISKLYPICSEKTGIKGFWALCFGELWCTVHGVGLGVSIEILEA